MTDLSRLQGRVERAASRTWPGATVTELVRLEGGYSSDTFKATVDGGGAPAIVVKVAPAGVPPVRNRDVLRQARVLRGLAGAGGVRVPEVYFEDPGDPPAEPPLFAMTCVEGECLEPNLDDVPVLPPPEEIGSRARSAARQLGLLHAVEPAAVGIGEEPAVSLEDEIDRWDRAFETVPEDLQKGWQDCSAALRRGCPQDLPPSLIHGDFRLGNTLCRNGEVTAIIDWEIWGVGDARLDLVWFLLTADPGRHPSLVRAAPGMPKPEELLSEYVTAGGPEPASLDWFYALVLYKLGSTSALLVKRQLKSGSVTPELRKAADQVPEMTERARALLP